MKQLAHQYVCWKGINRDIEQLSKICQSCAEVKTSHVKVPVHPWDEPKGNWDHIDINYAGSFQDRFFLIVDTKSRLPEIKICRSPPTSPTTSEILSNVFAVHGYPHVMMLDNATIFVSDQFKLYCGQNRIFQKFMAPGYPAKNGLTECMYRHSVEINGK
jgi:hypothetical protein